MRPNKAIAFGGRHVIAVSAGLRTVAKGARSQSLSALSVAHPTPLIQSSLQTASTAFRNVPRHHQILFRLGPLLKQPQQQPPVCLRRRLPAAKARPPRSIPARRRRTPTPPSVVSLPTCSSPTSSVTRSARTTLESSSARLASFSVRSGRASTRSSVLPMRPRLLPTRSATRRRRPPTKPVATMMRKRSLSDCSLQNSLPSFFSMSFIVPLSRSVVLV